MELERTAESGTYLATLTAGESAAFSSTYREHITEKALRGEEITDQELDLSELDRSGAKLRLSSTGIQHALDTLNAFSDNTADAVRAIPSRTGIPPFKNTYIPERVRHGKVAKSIAGEMSSKALNFDLGVE